MKNLEICKINYRKNATRKTRYKIVPAGKIPNFTSKVTSMQFRTVPKAIAKRIIVNKSLSKKYYTIIWKLSYPNQLLHSCKYNLKCIKHNIAELYKRLTTKNCSTPEYKYTNTTTGELFKDWKEVLKDMWWHIKHGHLPPVYVHNKF